MQCQFQLEDEADVSAPRRDFYRGFAKLLINILPTVTATAGYKGRLTCSRAVENYLHNQGDTHGGSGLLKALANTSKQYGVHQADIARFDILNIQAALANVTPTSFWTIYHISYDPSLLLRIRHEVQRCITTEALQTTDISSLDIGKLRTTCPLLHSTFQEILRTRSYNASVYVVLQDTPLQNRYSLKNHGVIHLPGHVIHNDTTIWVLAPRSSTPTDSSRNNLTRPSKSRGDIQPSSAPSAVAQRSVSAGILRRRRSSRSWLCWCIAMRLRL